MRKCSTNVRWILACVERNKILPWIIMCFYVSSKRPQLELPQACTRNMWSVSDAAEEVHHSDNRVPGWPDDVVSQVRVTPAHIPLKLLGVQECTCMSTHEDLESKT